MRENRKRRKARANKAEHMKNLEKMNKLQKLKLMEKAYGIELISRMDIMPKTIQFMIEGWDAKTGERKWHEYHPNPETGKMEKVFYPKNLNSPKKRRAFKELGKEADREVQLLQMEAEEVSLMEELKKPDLDYAKDMNAQRKKMRGD